MRANRALKTVLEQMAADREVHEFSKLMDGYDFLGYSYDPYNNRIHGRAAISDDEWATIFHILKQSYPRYALLFIHETLLDNSLTFIDNMENLETIAESELDAVLLRIHGKAGELAKAAADHIKNGKLSRVEIGQQIALHRGLIDMHQQLVHSLMQLRRTKRQKAK